MSSEYLQSIQAGLSPAQRLYQVVEHGMCIGCGICESVAGPSRVKMRVVRNGFERPVVTGELDHATVDRIIDVCPGTRVEGLPQALVEGDSRHDDVWGVWREIAYAWAGDDGVRHLSSTGGALTGLALHLLDSGEVDFILHAREWAENPTFGVRWISRNREDVLAAAGSRYGPTATLIDIGEVLERAVRDQQTFAFIGTPCDVSALRNLASLDERVDRHCRFMLTMVCGGFMEPAGLRTFLEGIGVNFADIESLRYRGYGCPGPTTVRTVDGREISRNYLDFWGEDDSGWQLPPRCKVCPDGIGDAADIAASDTWDGGSPTWEGQVDDPGFNAVVVRTRRGQELLARAVESGHIVRGDDLTPDDMNRFQPHQEAKKRSVWARFEGMRAAGNVVPDTRGLRLEALHGQNAAADNERQTAGTAERIRAGKFREQTPD